jgi:hypothetical protein
MSYKVHWSPRYRYLYHITSFCKKLEENKLADLEETKQMGVILEEPKKPGTTRVGFIVICIALVVLAIPVVVLSLKADVETLKTFANVALGTISSLCGAAVAYFFTK